AERNVYATPHQLGDRCDAAGELEVGDRTMHDVTGVRDEQLDVGGHEMRAMDGDEVRTGDPQTDQAPQRIDAEFGDAARPLVAGLQQMRLDRQIQLARVDDDLVPAR